MSDDILAQAEEAILEGDTLDQAQMLPRLLAEAKRLRSLIEDTAANWLKLEPGIAWEGGIDAAMGAAVKEVERLRSENRQWNADYEKLHGHYDDLLKAFEASEEFRRAYMNGKYQMYALGNDAITAAVELYFPCNEGPLDRKFRELVELPRLIAKDARIEELSALNESLMENGNDLRSRCQKAEERNQRLEAAFLKAYMDADYGHSEAEARLTLEEIRRADN